MIAMDQEAIDALMSLKGRMKLSILCLMLPHGSNHKGNMNI